MSLMNPSVAKACKGKNMILAHGVIESAGWEKERFQRGGASLKRVRALNIKKEGIRGVIPLNLGESFGNQGSKFGKTMRK